VPGTLSVKANAPTPLLELAAAQSFATMLGRLKTAPAGSALTAQFKVGGNPWGPVLAFAPGSASVSVSVAAAGAIAANALITLDITAVGSGTPGSDLTVLLR
jgi:hypothetical protein